jgi:putative endopeptidase
MKRYMPVLLVICLVILSLVSCKPNKKGARQRTFLETANMDPAIRPGDNFYLYVNNTWIKNTPIPATEIELGSFLDLRDQNEARMHRLLEEVARGSRAVGSTAQLAGDFYASGMDSAAIEKRGYDPVKPCLQQIDTIRNAKGIMAFASGQQLENNRLLFGQSIGADEKNSHRNIASYEQSGLGLPDRDYYFKTDPATRAIVLAYQRYIQQLFILTGDDPATATSKMRTVYALEKQLAASHRTREELRDPQSNYHKLTVAQLDKTMPLIHWSVFLAKAGIRMDTINVRQPAYYAKLDELLGKVPAETWKNYLRFHMLDHFADALSSDFANATFAYYGRALNGQQQIAPRWQRMVQGTDQHLGDALGQLYVKAYFTQAAKKRVLEMVNNLQTAFEARISQLDWMSAGTKIKAKEKLRAFLKNIGYPDRWRDYKQVTIKRDRYFENRLSCDQNDYRFQLSKIGKPVDRTEWQMTPPTIDARYNRSFNEIAFPAGILQYPFFDAQADDAVNYGGIGMVIGHEMTHGFDDQGSQYDQDGNLENWWKDTDRAKFKAKAGQLIRQYNHFIILDTLYINGRLTQGENIADLGGIAIAYDAFKKTRQGRGNQKIDGFTPDQRFFISFAQIWRWKMKAAAGRLHLTTDVHAPAMIRVNGTLMNFSPFYQAFDVRPGDHLFRPAGERIKIW